MRISGPAAGTVGEALVGRMPAPRWASLRNLRDGEGALLDQALVLWFPGPATATGEDLLELHLHGGRAIVRAVSDAVGAIAGVRPALPGEFTRRALANGRIDLAQAEGLADLIAAETEHARCAALAAADGAVGRAVGRWSEQLVRLSAMAEAQIDFADEDDVPASETMVDAIERDIAALAAELREHAARPAVERLHDGVRVVLAGPPNSGKSSLLNAMVGRDVALATPIAGTTRDRIEVPVVRDGIAWLLIDAAGLRSDSDDPVERLGIAVAEQAIATADMVVWLGDTPAPFADAIAVHARADLPDRNVAPPGRLALSARTGAGLDELWRLLGTGASQVLPRIDGVAFNARQRAAIAEAASELSRHSGGDLLLMSESLRRGRHVLSTVTGGMMTDDVLDALFGRFCIGK